MLTIIVKGTNGCNLACSYCSLGEKKFFKFVDKNKLKKIFSYACECARYRNEKNVTFILHGGEPTLVSVNIYEDAIESLKKAYFDLNISFCMQTNGVRITEEFIEFAKRFEINIGVSIDGAEEVHDNERRTIAGGPSYEIITSNIDRMLKAGLNVSGLMVLTKYGYQYGYEFLNYFSIQNIHLKINPLLNYGEVYEHPELSLEQGEYAKYLIGLYEYIIENDIAVNISPIDNILIAVLNEKGIGECSFSSECGKHFLCIDYNGDIYPCGKFSDMDKLKIGNIDNTEPGDVTAYINKKLVGRRNKKIPDKCKECDFLHLCNGGCSAEALIDGNFNSTPILCEDYKMLFEYFYHDGMLLLKKELQRQKKILEER